MNPHTPFSPQQLFAASQLIQHVNEAVLSALYVGRAAGDMPDTIFGNPFRVDKLSKSSAMAVLAGEIQRHEYERALRPQLKLDALIYHRLWLTKRMRIDESYRKAVMSLAGHVLSCWCRGVPDTWFCHAQTLAIESNGL